MHNIYFRIIKSILVNCAENKHTMVGLKAMSFSLLRKPQYRVYHFHYQMLSKPTVYYISEGNNHQQDEKLRHDDRWQGLKVNTILILQCDITRARTILCILQLNRFAKYVAKSQLSPPLPIPTRDITGTTIMTNM